MRTPRLATRSVLFSAVPLLVAGVLGGVGVAATSARDAWAVGCWACVSSPNQALILRWNGTTWKRVLTPSGFLFVAAATSASDAWAVGYNGNLSSPKTLIEHWNGTTWK